MSSLYSQLSAEWPRSESQLPTKVDTTLDSQALLDAGADHPDNLPPYDRALRTRTLCILGLVSAWIFGAGLLICGIIFVQRFASGGASRYTIPYIGAEMVALAVNAGVTLLVESAGYIHTCSLRWALLDEGRLAFNSTLRLLSSPRRSGPNRWYSNAIVFVCTTLAYASSSTLFFVGGMSEGQTVVTSFSSLTVQPLAILVLGITILGLAIMNTWALKSAEVLSWSSSPIHTALAAMHAGRIKRQQDRCMMSIHETKLPSGPTWPKNRQAGALSAHREVKWVVSGLWVLVILIFVWGGIIAGVVDSVCDGFSWSLLGDSYGAAGILFGNAASPAWLGALALFATVQAPLTLALHCAELRINLSRDEAHWRRASSSKGCRLEHYDSVRAAFTSWQSVVLTLFKTILHWFFGLSVQVYASVAFRPAQIIYLAAALSVCAGYITLLSLRGPPGAQPAAFGHLQTLVDLIDEWPDVMYWGNKGSNEDTDHAGIASHPLPPVEGGPYCGLYRGATH